MSLSRRIRTSVVTALLTGAGALFAAGCGLLGTASPAAASNNQLSMFEVPSIEGPSAGDTTSVLQTLRYLGVGIIRVGIGWQDFAPNPNSRTRPSFNASNPASYDWGWVDALVNNARRHGIQVDLLIEGGAPLWATQPGAPPPNNNTGLGLIPFDHTFRPSASEYGQFVHAVGAQFAGRVHFWELWNEANWGPSLTPQYQGSSLISAKLYRGLLDAGYSALRSTGHAHDAISIGNLSQDSSAHVGATGTSAPLIFMRTLYCLGNSYRPLKGGAARRVGCGGSKSSFRHAHPALFSASGVGIHPYPFDGNPPTHPDFPNPNGAEFSELPHVIKALDRIQRAYRSHKRQVIYNTEYAYRTRPPDVQAFFTTPEKAAVYINQAEYISWKNPRIATYDQYELTDGGSFPTGLFFSNGQPKPSFYSYRLPIWLPHTSTKRGRSLEVWGDVRAAHFARGDTGQAQSVQIQFAPGGSSTYRTVKTVRITNKGGYFDTGVKFPGSGSVRLTWTYPNDPGLTDPLATLNPGLPAAVTSPQVFSRTMSIRLH